jgi:hypothetical protein
VGVLQRFEQRLDSLVNGAFAKAFRAEVQPVEIAGALQRELDDKAVPLSPGRTVGPNTFVVELSKSDHERLGPYEQPLSQELGAMVREHAQASGTNLLGDVEIELRRSDDLGTGMFRVASATTPGVTAQPQPRPLYEPLVDDLRPATAAPSSSAPGAPAADQPLAPAVAPDAFAAATAEPAPAPSAWRPSAGARLVVHGTAYPLSKSAVTIGRGSDVDIRIDDPGVSRKHATFHLGEPWTVVDLASTNGTWLRDQRISEHALADGDEIRVGSTVLTFKVG